MELLVRTPARVWLLLLVFGLLAPIPAAAQESGVVGTGRDTSGAVVGGTDITLTNTQTGESRRATTNDNGQYVIPNVKAAIYQLTAEKAGFQKHVVDDLKLEVELVRTVDVVLSVGAVADQVTVAAAAAQLQAADSTVSTLFETKVVNELPLNGRNFLQLQLLAPGVTMGRPGTFSAVQIAAQNTSIGGGNFSVNGMRDVYNDYLLDGVSFKDWIHGTNGMNPSVDAVQEFRTQTSNYPAEFGANAGGVVNMITKSGTNSIRGSADHGTCATMRLTPTTSSPTPSARRSRRCGATSSAAPSVGRSCRTGPSSSAATRASARIARARSSARCRQPRCTTVTSRSCWRSRTR